MKPLPAICLLILILLNVKGFNAFSQKPVFTKVPQPESGGAYLITQDPKGYMWFGGLGLHRYDGYSYKSYFWDPLDSTSLAGNKIDAIWADRKGFIWIATTINGLDRLDPETGIFKHYRYKPGNPNSISSDTLSTVIEDRNGKIWIGTQTAGLNCLDPATGNITRYKHSPSDSNSLSFNQVTALYEDHQGTIWVGTGGLWIPPPDYKLKYPGGLNRFNRTKNNFTRFLHDPENPASLIDNRIFSLFEDSKARFWVGTSGDGLHTLNREKGSFERHRYSAADKNGFSRPPVINIPGRTEDMISFIREDSTGAFWIGTLSGGMNRYDPESGEVNYYESLNEESEVKDPYVHFVGSYISKDGVLWVGSYEGLYHLDPFHKKVSRHEAGGIVTSSLQDRTGKLWIGTLSEGLRVYDSTGKNSIKLIQDNIQKNKFIGNIVNSIFENRRGAI